jgi:predicted phage terminase large subunit-like protein
LRAAVKAQAEKFAPHRIVIEDKGSGTQLIQELPMLGVFGVVPYSPGPGTDKIVRLYNQWAQFESGNVLLPRQAPWLEPYLQELLTFPGSKYDDQVDSTTQALEYMKTLTNLEMWARLGR